MRKIKEIFQSMFEKGILSFPKRLIEQVKQFNINSDKLDVLINIQQKNYLASVKSGAIDIQNAGFSVYSESDEDGLLLYIFGKIGFGNKKLVDIGGGTGLLGSNTANLIINHQFTALIIEGNSEYVPMLADSFRKTRSCRHIQPKIINLMVTTKNINDLLKSNFFVGEIDLLSIDIDSIDFWVWEAINVISPRVVIVEFQCIIEANSSVSVPKDFREPIFLTHAFNTYGVYNSASLLAFVKLANRRGYRLVATSALGFNAIFVKEELGKEDLPAISVEEGLNKPFVKWAQQTFGIQTNELNWVEVE